MEKTAQYYYHPLFGFIKKRVQNTSDAEDLTQEVFYKLSKSDTSKIDNIKSWIYTIAKNAIIDYYRKKKMEMQLAEEDMIQESEHDSRIIGELSDCVLAFIEELSPEYRKLLKLSEIDGMSQKEIAQQLQMNYATVRSKIQRARQQLKEIFSKCCNIETGGMGSIMDYQKKSGCC